MAKGYWVVTYRAINNPESFQAYAKLAAPAIIAGGGKYLIRGMPAATHEKGMNQRVVVTEFPNVKAAIAAHDGAAYQAALKELKPGAVERDLRIVEGVE
jgi:uncharacterized protein (DUF1330 family)